MSKGGFSAVVKINKIEIGTGFSSNNSRNIAEIEMDGYIREDTELDYRSTTKDKKETYAHVYIEFDDEPDYSEYSYDEETNRCIGELSVQTDGDSEISAFIRIILKTKMLNTLLAIKDHYITVDPIFFRKPGEKTKYVENTEDGLVRYIERIYFEPYIEDKNT